MLGPALREASVGEQVLEGDARDVDAADLDGRQLAAVDRLVRLSQALVEDLGDFPWGQERTLRGQKGYLRGGSVCFGHARIQR